MCIYIYIYTSIPPPGSVYMCVFMYVYIYICIYIYIYIHVYIHMPSLMLGSLVKFDVVTRQEPCNRFMCKSVCNRFVATNSCVRRFCMIFSFAKNGVEHARHRKKAQLSLFARLDYFFVAVYRLIVTADFSYESCSWPLE